MEALTISDIILYIVLGFIFMQIFNFIVSNQSSNDFQHIFFKSLIIGFILVNVMSTLPFTSNNIYLYALILVMITVILSYIMAQIYCSTVFKNICKFIKVRRTVNPYIWNDIEDKKQTLWIRIGFKELNLKYVGILACVEDFQRQPLIVLTRYSKCGFLEDENGETSIDFTNDPKQRIVLDTSKADYIEFVYDKDSEVIREK